MKPGGVSYIIVIRALPGVDPIRNLRWILKGLLRQHGFQCTDIREISNATTSEPDTSASA
jgi:hypothetical protein